MKEWYLFLIAIGSLVLAMSPMFNQSTFSIFSGIVIIIIGLVLYLREKKG